MTYIVESKVRLESKAFYPCVTCYNIYCRIKGSFKIKGFLSIRYLFLNTLESKVYIDS